VKRTHLQEKRLGKKAPDMDIFDQKGIKPMLISEIQEPFDDPNCIYELKLDGERCVVYLDKSGTTMQNKRDLILNPRYPELREIHKAAKVKCILDGELTVLVDGKPHFSQIQRRSLMSNKFKIEVASNKYPACFAAFDILYYKDKPVMDLPLMERKTLLEQAINENEKIAVSRYIEEQGKAFYRLAADQDLEGIVAKKKDSKYFPGKRTKDWIKIKNLKDDDFVVCGYIEKENNVVSIVLGQYDDQRLLYRGHVTLGVSREDFNVISHIPHIDFAPFKEKGNEDAIWLQLVLVCTVKYMARNETGMLRQPVYKGLRDDKKPEDCKA
jgi:bifunctional non-homologous end joining protein LigD